MHVHVLNPDSTQSVRTLHVKNWNMILNSLSTSRNDASKSPRRRLDDDKTPRDLPKMRQDAMEVTHDLIRHGQHVPNLCARRTPDAPKTSQRAKIIMKSHHTRTSEQARPPTICARDKIMIN